MNLVTERLEMVGSLSSHARIKPALIGDTMSKLLDELNADIDAPPQTQLLRATTR
jgi:hypothetical protein